MASTKILRPVENAFKLEVVRMDELDSSIQSWKSTAAVQS